MWYKRSPMVGFTDNIFIQPQILEDPTYRGLISHLPDRVCVFAVFGSTPMDRFFLLHIVNTDTPIIEPYSHHIGVLRVNVQAHHPTVSLVDIFSKGRIFQGEKEDHSTTLLHKVICNNKFQNDSMLQHEILPQVFEISMYLY